MEGLKGSYDAVISLGDLCLTSIQLKKNGLRNFSGVLDWMASPKLSDVNRLLKNKFSGFFDRGNLRIIGYAGDTMICVADDHYGLVSNHDYGTDKNTLQYLGSHDEVINKYNRRIQRVLHTMETAERLLFVRTEGSFEEVLELQEVLSELVKGEFKILLVNHGNVDGIVERSWPVEDIYSVTLPNVEKWEGNNHLWKQLLEGVQLKG
nr:DUF1796 family putative cysteine peptidase [Metabacillus lacus]